MREEKISIFYSYAQEDEKLQKKLDQHLSMLHQQGVIVAWHKRNIHVGSEWEKEIDNHINSAQIILLLISASFLASRYCYGVELQRALERQKCGDALVIPIILRPVDWRESPFGKLEVLPRGAKPVTGRGWKNLDEAFASIAHDIRTIVTGLEGSAMLANLISPLPLATQLTPSRVLIVEDDERVAAYIKRILWLEGIQSEHAINGAEGIMKAENIPPELIIVDLAMPIIEGFEVIRRLRATPKNDKTPIIVLTAHDNDLYHAKAIDLGANYYMIKPFHINELLWRVKSFLR